MSNCKGQLKNDNEMMVMSDRESQNEDEDTRLMSRSLNENGAESLSNKIKRNLHHYYEHSSKLAAGMISASQKQQSTGHNHLDQVFDEAAAEESTEEGERSDERRLSLASLENEEVDTGEHGDGLNHMDAREKLLAEFSREFHCQRIREFAAYEYDKVSPMTKSMYRFSLACPAHIVVSAMCMCFLVVFVIQGLVIVHANTRYDELTRKLLVLSQNVTVVNTP